MMFCIYMCTFSCKQFLVSTDNVKILLILKNYLMKRDTYLILSQRIVRVAVCDTVRIGV